MNTQFTGRLGEDLAVSYLKDQGYFILDRNYHTKFGEIDIVGAIDDEITFFEVKFRRNDSFGHPDEAITPSKIVKIKKSIEVWITKRSHEIHYTSLSLKAIIINPDKSILKFDM